MVSINHDLDFTHSVNKRNDGRWYGTLRFTHPRTGERDRFQTTGKTRKEVVQRLRDAEARIALGAPVKDSSRTVGEWCNQWLRTSLQASDWADSTKETYSSALMTHVIGQPVGDIRLDRLCATDVEEWIVGLRAKKTARGKTMSSATVNKYFQVLRVALDFAVRDGVIGRNVVREDLREPKVTKTRKPLLSDDETLRLCAALRGGRYLRAVQLIAMTGLRESEALGLKWEDIDLNAGLLSVQRTLTRKVDEDGILQTRRPKTATSERMLPLGAEGVAILRKQHTDQLHDRLKAGSEWMDTGHVFTTASGRPTHQRNLLRAVHNAAAKARIRLPGDKKVDVHMLRHSAGSAFLQDGATAAEVRDLMGHSDLRATSLYVHSVDDRLRAAVERRGQALKPA